ncbi:MAG: hypothetical protein PHD48_00275 [Alphaproteobacteria bacterium]|nr:hypothetical protein [Alphaproteobacteria bacterium]
MCAATVQKFVFDPTKPIVPYSYDTPVVSPELERTVREFGAAGLEICVVDRIGPPAVMRALMGIDQGACVVCSMMAGSPMEGYPILGPAVYSYAYDLAKLNLSHPFLHMPPINGGGADSPITGRPGLMGCHSKGVVDGGYPLYCVITEGLVTKEGLRFAPGTVICLMDSEGDSHLGLRTDSLIGLANIILFWPGGFGTDTEALIRLTNTSINGKARGSRCLFVNMPSRDPYTREPIGYFDLTFRKNLQSYGYGGIKLDALKNLNNQVAVYNPYKDITIEQLKTDVLSLVFAFRKYESRLTATDRRSMDTLPPDFLDMMIQPLSKGSTITCPYPGIGANGTWLDTIRAEVRASSQPPTKIYRPDGSTYG